MGNIGSTAMGFTPNRKKHQSNEYIKDAGLNWMDFNFRQYDPQIGRFLSVDLLAAAQGQEIHSPYAAMGNEPEMMIDPNGLASNPAMRNWHFKGDAFWSAVGAYYGNPLIGTEFGSIESYESFMSNRYRSAGEAMLAEQMFEDVSQRIFIEQMKGRSAAMGNSGYVGNFAGITSRDVDNRWYFDGDGDGEAGVASDPQDGNGNKGKNQQTSEASTLDKLGIGIGLSDYARQGLRLGIRQPGVIKFFATVTNTTAQETKWSFSLLSPAYNGAGKLFFWGGIALSTYQGWSNIRQGNYNAAAKNGLDIGMGTFGLYNPISGALYFGVDAFYPGGWKGLGKDQQRLDNNNSFNPYWQIWPGAMKQ